MTPEEILDKGKSILKSKGEDYTESIETHRYQNFQRQAEIISWFKDPADQAFACMIAVKLARLAALLNDKDKTPNHEAIADTFVDGSNYFALWGGYSTQGEPKPAYTCGFCGMSFYARPYIGQVVPGVSLCSPGCFDNYKASKGVY